MHAFGTPRHAVNESILHDFARVFLEFPVKNNIMGMLLTCPIRLHVPGYIVSWLLTCYLLFIDLKL